MNKHPIILGMAVLLLTVGLSGCTEFGGDGGTIGGKMWFCILNC